MSSARQALGTKLAILRIGNRRGSDVDEEYEEDEAASGNRNYVDHGGAGQGREDRREDRKPRRLASRRESTPIIPSSPALRPKCALTCGKGEPANDGRYL